ncbi:uncharacterized protein METZ01_LOCUS470671, partial [marine metagenome]
QLYTHSVKKGMSAGIATLTDKLNGQVQKAQKEPQ